MERQLKNSKPMWKNGGIIITMFIANIISYSCNQKKDNTNLCNDTTILTFPTYEEFCEIHEPIISSVTTLIIKVKNNSDSNLVVIGGTPLKAEHMTKSRFYLANKEGLISLRLRGREAVFEPNTIDEFFELSLDLPNKFKPNCISEKEYNSLRDSIYTIAREGVLLYVPNEEDFKEYVERRRVEYEYSQNKYRFLNKPILISRESTKFVYKSYLLPEGIDTSEL